jgi:hypothetical protein
MTPLEAAVAQLGYRGNGDRYWAGVDPALVGDEWCAAFVSWCFVTAGEPLPAIEAGVVGFTYCPDAERWAKTHGAWTSSGAPGDIVLYCWDGSGTAQHTGIVESLSATGIVAIEGNTGSPVGVWRANRPNSVILGYFRPKETKTVSIRKGIDCVASSYPGAAALVAAGYSFMIGYISWGTPWKDLTREMVDDCAAHGIDVVLNFEAEAQPSGGRTEGLSVGQRVASQREALGVPAGRPCYYSADFEAQPLGYPSLDAYFAGIHEGDPTGGLPGAYADGAYLLHALDAGLIAWSWLSCSTGFPGYAEALASGRLTMSQSCGGSVAGRSVDIDTDYVTDFGQWRPGTASPTAPSASSTSPTVAPVHIAHPTEELLNMDTTTFDGAAYATRDLFWRYVHKGPSPAEFKAGVEYFLKGGTLNNFVSLLQESADGARVTKAVQARDTLALGG